jgi:hypothetical protein
MKKGLWVAGAVALLLGLLFGRESLSYVGTFVGMCRDNAKEAIPVDFQIERAKQEVKNLDPDIARNMHLIAKEEVELANLEKDIAARDALLAKARTEIERLANDLKRGDSTYVYCGINYNAKQVESDLARRFESFKQQEKHLNVLKERVGIRKQGLAAAQEKLAAMQSAKEDLMTNIETQKSRLEMVRVAQATSDLKFDDSRLSRTKSLIQDISTRIDVQEKMVGNAKSTAGQIRLEESTAATGNIAEQVTEYLHGKSAEVAVKLD